MGNRAQIYPDVGSSMKDQYMLGQRFQGVGATNGPLPAVVATTNVAAPPGANRGRGLLCSRTGVGSYTITVQNNPTAPGGCNYTPQFIQMLDVNLMTPGATKWAWTFTGYAFAAGVLTLTIQTYIANTGVVTDVPTTDEIWVVLSCSANSVA